jgi:hypothetical protein
MPNREWKTRCRRFLLLEVAVAPILLGCLSANVSWADDPSTHDGPTDAAGGVPPAPVGQLIAEDMTEWGLVGGFGDAHDVFNGVTPERFVQGGVRVGRVLTGPIGPGALSGNFEVSLEVLPIFVLFQDEVVYGASVTLLFRHYMAPGHRVRPFVSFGAGPLVSSKRVPMGTSRLNFTPQIGFGLAWQSAKHILFTEYRLHHISNANIAEPNPGINSSYFQFGVSVFR